MKAHLTYWRLTLAVLSLFVAAAAAPQGLTSWSSAQEQDQEQAKDDERSADDLEVAKQRAAAEQEAAEAAAAVAESEAGHERTLQRGIELRKLREEQELRERGGEEERNPTRAMREQMRRYMERMQQVQERIVDLEKQIEQRRGNNESTEELLNEVEKLRKERQSLAALPAMQAYRQRQLHERLEALTARAAQLEQEQRHDEVAALRREIERIRTQQRLPENIPGQPHPGREDHLRIAIEHLHAAGLHEIADRVAQQGGGREADRENRPRLPGEASNNNQGRRGDSNRRDMNQYQHEMMQMMQRVHEEMAAMHKEIEELRAIIEVDRDDDGNTSEDDDAAKQ